MDANFTAIIDKKAFILCYLEFRWVGSTWIKVLTNVVVLACNYWGRGE